MHRLPVDGFYLKRCKVTRFLRIMKLFFRCFIVTVRRGNNIFAILSSPCSAGTIFLPFYRRRAARKQYFCHFIVTARRGNDTFAVLSSPCSAGTIFSPFYRHRAAREQYFCHFIVTVRRGNNIFAVLSSSRGAGTIFLPFYRHRAARKRYFNYLLQGGHYHHLHDQRSLLDLLPIRASSYQKLV